MITLLNLLACIAVMFLPFKYQYSMALFGQFQWTSGWFGGLLSYMFVHSGWPHIAANFTLILPSMLYMEQKHGRLRAGLVYLLGGVGAGLCHMLFTSVFGDGFGILIGSSGAAYSITTLALFTLAREHKIVSMIMFLSLFIEQLLMGAMSLMRPDETAFWCHVGGVLMALALIPWLFELSPRRKKVVVKIPEMLE